MKITGYFLTSFFLILSIFSFSQEICDNGIDDDGNGLIDLNDPSCVCDTVAIDFPSIIPNPSFEDYSSCPYGFGQMDRVNDWLQPTSGTSDYFNCGYATDAAKNAGISAPTGTGYVGAIYASNYIEYIGTCLLSPLKAGISYTLAFKIASAPMSEGKVCSKSYGNVDVSIFGAALCSDIPMTPNSYKKCPSIASPAWNLLGGTNYSPSKNWETIQITFTPSIDINAIAIGPPCGTLSYPSFPGCIAYFYYDDMHLVRSEDTIPPTIMIDEKGNLCANDKRLEATPDISGGNWQWYKNGIALVGETSNILDISSNNYTAGDYQVRYILGAQCRVVNYTLDPDYTPDFIGSSECYNGWSGGTQPEHDFWDMYPDPSNVINRKWDFGDGSTGTGLTTKHRYPSAGKYDVTLTITTKDGCVYSVTKPVYLWKPKAIIVIGSTDPSCGGSDGTITFGGLAPNTTYSSVNYKLNDTLISTPYPQFTSNSSGEIVITGLSAGDYTGFRFYGGPCSIASYPFKTVTLTSSNTPSTPTISTPTTMCVGGNTQNLTGSPSGGSWSSSNTSVATINSSGQVTSVGNGTTTITYSFTACSTTLTATATITVNNGVTPTFTQISAFCENTSAPTLPTSSIEGVTGSWDRPVDNTNDGTYTFTPDAGQCATTQTMDITVTATTTGTDVITSCSPITWIDGITYSTNNNLATHTLTGSNGCDSVVTLNFILTATTTGTDIITSCDPIIWLDGNTYSANNNSATHTITGGSVNGCDSIVTLDFTLNSASNGTDVITDCNPIVWLDGNTYSASNNTATHTLVGGATNGCDSIVTLDFTLNSATNGTDVIVSCGPIVWLDGNTYSTNNNTATHTLVAGAANGCDSIITLDFTLNTFASGNDVITDCNPITWLDGNTYSSSNNTATHTIVGGSFNGCDSIVTLDFTLNSATNGTDVITDCNPITWLDGITYSANNTTATHTITGGSVNGCDSIVTLDFALNTFTSSTDLITSCGPITWLDGITYSTSNNIATHTISGGSVNGCDSVVTLNLTIKPNYNNTENTSICSGSDYTYPDRTVSTNITVNENHISNLFTAEGCDSIITTNITVNPIITGTLDTTICNGGNILFYGITLSGANPTGTVTLMAVNGCDSVVTITVTESQVIQANITTTQATCNQSNGTATSAPTGGTAPYSYTWNTAPIQTTPTASNLIAANYNLTVTDNIGCTTTDLATITNASGPSTTATANIILCNGDSTTATANATGGTAPYTYSWNTSPIQTTPTANNLTAGTYTVTATDSNNCTSSTTITLTQPTLLTTTTSTTNVTCNAGNDGTATAIPNGGTTPYTYSWDSNSEQNTITATGLIAKSYTVTVTDSNGCVATDVATITSPAPITLNITGFAVSCNGASDGQAVVTPTGGTGSYTYNWQPGNGTGSNHHNLTAGTYIITVTDNSNCMATDSIVITAPSVLTTTMNGIDATCNNANGVITTTPTGGTAPYTYSWNTTPVQTTNTINNLAAGSYSVTVTDNNNCTATETTSIVSIATPTITTTEAPIGCNGGTGELTATATGGASPYTYSWNTTPIQTTPTATNLTTGSYIITITDGNGCINSETINLTEPELLQVAVTSLTNTSCNQDNGKATVTTTGGTLPYTYTWNTTPVQTTNAINNLPAGIYNVNVTDNNNCTANTTLTIAPSTAPSALFTTTPQQGCNIVCIDLLTDTAINNYNTNTPLSYSWSFERNNLPTRQGVNDQHPRICFNTAGRYHATLTVTDNAGCSSTRTLNNVAQVYPQPIASFTMSPTKTSIFDPVITFINTGENFNSLVWNFADEQNTISTAINPEFTYQSSGKYCPTLKVTSPYGCVDSTTNCLEITPEFTFYAPNSFTPDGNTTNEGWSPKGIGIDENNYELLIFDRWGELIWQTKTWGEQWDGSINGLPVQIDTYIWKANFKDTAEKRNHNYIGKVTVIK